MIFHWLTHWLYHMYFEGLFCLSLTVLHYIIRHVLFQYRVLTCTDILLFITVLATGFPYIILLLLRYLSPVDGFFRKFTTLQHLILLKAVSTSVQMVRHSFAQFCLWAELGVWTCVCYHSFITKMRLLKHLNNRQIILLIIFRNKELNSYSPILKELSYEY